LNDAKGEQDKPGLGLKGRQFSVLGRLLSRTEECRWKKGNGAAEAGETNWFQRAHNGLKDGAGVKLVSENRG
jgi:hypothetical protein